MVDNTNGWGRGRRLLASGLWLVLVAACTDDKPGSGNDNGAASSGGGSSGGVIADAVADGGASDSGSAGDAGAVGDAGSVEDAGSSGNDGSSGGAATDGGADGAGSSGGDGGPGTSSGGDAGTSSGGTIEEQPGDWPSKPVRLSDDGLWIPTRTIKDASGKDLVLRSLPPLLKPEKTRFVPQVHQVGVISIIFREGYGLALVDGKLTSTTGADLKGLAAVQVKFGAGLGPLRATFVGKKADLDAQRLKLEQKTKKALRDRTLMMRQDVDPTVDLAALADTYNDLPFVELAAPLPRNAQAAAPKPVGTTTSADTGRRTGDFTPWQIHLLGSNAAAGSAGGHGVPFLWSLEGGRGENTEAAQIEYHWNRQHEDIDWTTTPLLSPWGGNTTQLAGVSHDMGCLGIYKARNDAVGVTGICSETKMHVAPSSRVDNVDEWAGLIPTLLNGSDWSWNFAQVTKRLADITPAGSFASASLQTGGPNDRSCSNPGAAGASRDCAPRAQCMPAAPYVMDGGNPRLRCEGYPHLNAAANGCATHLDCHNHHTFGARCMPVPAPVPGLFGSRPAKWHCGGDASADECTTTNDCEPVARCINGRCGDFARAWANPGAAPMWVDRATANAGQACTVDTDCTVPLRTRSCRANSTCGGANVVISWIPEIHTAAAYAAANGLTLALSAGNFFQRMGLLSDDTYPRNCVGAACIDTLVGNDQYKRFFSCPFPGCQGSPGSWTVGATAGENAAPAWFTNRGPNIDIAGFGERVTTHGEDTTFPLHTEPALTGGQTNRYQSQFNGTSSAAPVVGALATALQGYAKATTGAALPAATILAALQTGVTIPGNLHEGIGVRPLMEPAAKHIVPATALTKPALKVETLGATAGHNPGLKTVVSVSFMVKNIGEQTSPPLGLRITIGKHGSAFAAPQAPGSKVASSGQQRTVGWTCIRDDRPHSCCDLSAGATATLAGCAQEDHDGRDIFLPMVDGTKAHAGGGEVRRFYRFEVPTPDYLTATGDVPEVCVMLDRQARQDVGSRLNHGGAPPDLHKCAKIGNPPDAIAISSTFGGKQKIRPYSFGDTPAATVCNADLVGNDKGVAMFDVAAVTRNRLLFLSAYPHSGTVGFFDAAACEEIDFDPEESTPSCGAPGSVNRLDFTGQTPGLANACDGAELTKKHGRNPMALAFTRDQRFVAVALGNLGNKCDAGKLAFIDLRDPADPKILTFTDGGGVTQPVQVPIGPNPKAVAITHEGTKDARIVVIHDTHSTQCKKAPHASVIKLKDVLDKGNAAPVKTAPFLYPCPGGTCAPRLPQQVVIDKNNLAAFVTFKQAGTGSKNTYQTGNIGVLRLSDLKAQAFFRKANHEPSWDRPWGLDVVNLGGSTVRVVFVADSFQQKSQDFSGNKCKAGFTCGAIHWHDIDVGAMTDKLVNAGRLIPDFTVPRDIVLSADGKHALVTSNNKRVARFVIGSWTDIKLDQNVLLEGGKRIIRLPEDDGFCPDERCNGKDDDCNGATDELWDKKGQACAVGLGICTQNGNLVCTADGLSLECSHVPGQPQTELCNGKDDDCDGQTDELWRDMLGTQCWVGVGQCKRFGKRVCDGSTTKCSAVAGKATAEKCNGLDDDCDGATDEDGACPKPDPCKGVNCGSGTCKSGGGGPWCDCEPGHSAVGLRCLKNPTCNVRPPKSWVCPAQCSGGCFGATCVIRCAGQDACKGAKLTCPSDWSCQVDCAGDGACAGAEIVCGDGLLCELRCQQAGACDKGTMTCGKGLCQASCWAGAGKLSAHNCGSACGCVGGCL